MDSDAQIAPQYKSWKNTVFLLLMASATAMLFFSLAVYFAYAVNLIQFPYDYDQGEGFELVDSIMFSELRWPYQNTDHYPFYSSNYPPIFHVMIAPFVWLFGPAYWYGRLLGFLGTLITAATIAYAVYGAGKNKWISLLSALAFLASNTIYHIGPLLRQHMTMVLFETLAVVILAQAYPRRDKRGILLGLFLIILAGYTKQLAAITGVAVCTWMMLRNPRRGVIWSIIFAGVGGLIFVWMTISTDGEWWRQAILANVNSYNPFQTFGLSLLWLRQHGFLILPAILMVFIEIYFERISLYTVWFGFSVILGAAGSGTWGAGDSYFATAIASMAILSGIFLSRLLSGDFSLRQNYIKRLIQPFQPLVPVLLLATPLLYVGFGITTFKMPTEGRIFGMVATILKIEPNVFDRHYDSATYDVPGYANIGHFVTQDDHNAGRYITEQIEQSEQPVLSEEAGFSLAAGRDVITNPTQLRNLWLAGFWDGRELIAMVENEEFGLIVTRAQFYPVPVLEALGQHYEVDETVRMNGFDYWLLRPQNRDRESR